MDSLLKVNRRALVRLGLVSAGAAPFSSVLIPRAHAQDAGPDSGSVGSVGGRAESELFLGRGLPGGGQLEIRLSATIYTSDPDALELAQSMKTFNVESCGT